MAATTILIIDDEPQIRRAVRNALSDDDVRVVEAATGSAGLDIAAAERPSLVILDLGLPDVSGLDVCRQLRSWSSAPVIVLSARHSDQEKVALLDAGADDYMTKPFSTVELQARVRAQLRRSRQTPVTGADETIEVDGVRIDLPRGALTSFT
jgi:two-component system, OmpR family, KDP operon response regulator KdpE